MTWGALGRGLPWEKCAGCIKALIDAGFTDKIFLPNDWMFGLSTYSATLLRTMDEKNPDGILFTIRKVIPYLKRIGVSNAAIHAITVENPRRFFGKLT